MHDMTRRSFLKIIAATTTLPAMDALAKPASKRPNILWISCEDISSHLGCYGEKHAITPNIDQFAKEGVRYTRAFTVHGVCAPSRSGIITGMYPSSIGSVNMRCGATIPKPIKCFPEYLRQAGYYCTNNSKEDYNFKTPNTAWDTSGNKAHWKNRPVDVPFFAVFNFTGTHESKLWNSTDFENTHPKRLKKSEWQKPENMTVPPIYPDVPMVRQDLARLFERITEFDYFVKDRIDELKQAGLYEETIIFIWSDHGNGLPRAKRWLYDSGTLSPLIVRVPNSHRIVQQASPNTADARLVNFIDLGPTVLNLTGIKTPEHMQGQAFLGGDLPPKRKYIFGARQRIDELCDMVRSVRNQRYRYIVNFMPFIPYLPHLEYAEKCNTMKALRRLHVEGKLNNIQAKWMAHHRDAEELYDLESDPWETNNLANNPGCSDTKKHLRKVLMDWMIETRDTGLIPEPEMMRLRRDISAEYLIFRQQGGQHRVKQLVELAFAVSQLTAADQPYIENALADDDPVARYWAALAMRSHPDGIKKLHHVVRDKNVCVRIAAADSLYRLGKKEQAVAILVRELQPSDPDGYTIQFVLSALNLLGNESSSALPIVKMIPEHKNKYVNRLRNKFVKKFSR